MFNDDFPLIELVHAIIPGCSLAYTPTILLRPFSLFTNLFFLVQVKAATLIVGVYGRSRDSGSFYLPIIFILFH